MRGIAFVKGVLAAVLCAVVARCPRAEEIEVRNVHLLPVEEGIALDADFAFDFAPRLAEMVANGVPLYFVVEFELTRPRWWWFDEKGRCQAHSAAAVLPCAVAPLPAFAPDCCSSSSRRWRKRCTCCAACAAGWSSIARSHLDRRELRRGAAHAARHDAVAQAVPAERDDQPRADAGVRLEALHLPAAPAGAAPVEARDPKEADTR